MTVFDIETDPQGKIVLIGVIKNGRYLYFETAKKFYTWIKKKGIRELFAHNLEFDFFKLYEDLPELKFCGYFSTAGLSYVQNGMIFFKDLMNHLTYSLAEIGKMLGFNKLTYDYSKIKNITMKLLKYNERDCRITYRALMMIKKIYKDEGCKKIKSTISSQAFQIFSKKFYKSRFKGVHSADIERWRLGYTGGWCQDFKNGEFNNSTYYKIDVNSMYAKMMLTSMPDFSDYSLVEDISKEIRKSCYWIGYNNEGYYNSIEHRKAICDFYYVFKKKCFPFDEFVKYFYPKKCHAKSKLHKKIYKKLMTSLYGKFAQRNETDVVSNYHYKKTDDIFYYETIGNNLHRIKFVAKNKYWVNIAWSYFITAKARQYMRNLKKYIERNGLTVYYTDTDSFIVSGDLDNIKNIINDDKLGLFKIEDIADSIDIRGKKFYRFGSIFKCKGVPREHREDFFKRGYVSFKRMTRYKEGLISGKRIGTFTKTSKSDLKNIQRRIL